MTRRSVPTNDRGACLGVTLPHVRTGQGDPASLRREDAWRLGPSPLLSRFGMLRPRGAKERRGLRVTKRLHVVLYIERAELDGSGPPDFAALDGRRQGRSRGAKKTRAGRSSEVLNEIVESGRRRAVLGYSRVKRWRFARGRRHAGSAEKRRLGRKVVQWCARRLLHTTRRVVRPK